MQIRIAQTWDGQPLDGGDVALLSARLEGDALVVEVDAPFNGDPPPPGAPGSTWGLWDHEVVELFVLGDDERYTELELGPHGHHLLLCLQTARHVTARELPVDFQAEIRGERWVGVARIDRALLPPGAWRGNAYAIRGVGEARRYMAWTAVPGPAPDFHQIDRFAPLEIDSP